MVRSVEFVGEGQGFVMGDGLQEGIDARRACVFGFGGVPHDGAPGFDHAEARIATDFFVVGAHELAEELNGFGDGVAEDVEASLAEEVLEAFGVGASLGAELGAGLVQLEGDVFPTVAFGAEFGDEGKQLGIGIGRRRTANSNHDKPSERERNWECAKRTTGGVTCLKEACTHSEHQSSKTEEIAFGAPQCPLLGFSPGGAGVVSQGRKPLVRTGNASSPGGAADSRGHLPPLRG